MPDPFSGLFRTAFLAVQVVRCRSLRGTRSTTVDRKAVPTTAVAIQITYLVHNNFLAGGISVGLSYSAS